MANCKELHKQGTPEYDACVEQKKAEELKLSQGIELSEGKEIKLDEIVLEAPKNKKDNKPVVKIEDNITTGEQADINLTYQDNQLENFETEPSDPTFWEKLKSYFTPSPEAITNLVVKTANVLTMDARAVSETKKQSRKTLEEIELPGNGLNNMSIDDPSTIITKDQAVYDPVFVEIGTDIKEGDVLCVIEAMKLFNEIESEISGKIVKVLVDDSSPVEFDQPLFLVDPS